jgi:hypothetical protein
MNLQQCNAGPIKEHLVSYVPHKLRGERGHGIQIGGG